MIHEEYYTRVMSLIPETIISDEFFGRNQGFIEAIIFDYFRIDERYDDFDPEQTADHLILFFSNLKNFGLR